MRTASRTWAFSALVVALVAIVGASVARGVRAGEAPRRAPRALSTAPNAAAPARLAAAAIAPPPAREELPARPRSLEGTDEDGALRVDEHGDLVVGPEVLRLFEYWCSATGEESVDAIRRRIARSIEARLEGRAAAKAKDLLDRFLAYREDAKAMSARDTDDLDARLREVRRLRRARFGADADALFGEDEAADAVAIERRRAMRDPRLGDDRARRIAAIDARLPPAYRAAAEAAARPVRERDEERAMRAAGASDDEIRRFRVANDGEAAADRLAELDARRAEWKRRVAAFDGARRALDAEPNEARRDAAIQALLEASFTPEERLRVEATRAR